MADKRYDSWSIDRIEEEIRKVRLIDLVRERELCFTLSEKAKLKNDHYALAFSYTYLSDCFLAERENSRCIPYLNLAKELSEAGHYEELLTRIYNFYGMFCNAISDEVNALDYFLKSLDISEKQQEPVQMASAYNNIAACFDIKHNYKEAVFYYKKSCEILSDTDPKMKYSKAVSLTNLCRCAYKLQQSEEIGNILTHFQVICHEDGDEKHILKILHLYCTAMKQHLSKEYAAFYQTLEQMLALQRMVQNKLLVHQIFTTICEMLLAIRDQAYSYQVLQLLSDINQKNEIKTRKELQKLIVGYCEAFETRDRQLEALQEYYRIMTAIEDMEQEHYSAGLLAKLELHNAAEQQGDLKKENEHLEQLMNTDDLCGIMNRRSLNSAIADNRRKPAENVGVAMLDIDYFKEYNDTYGHQKGDMALMAIGKILHTVSSEKIRVYRYGGDEFTILFLDQNEERIREVLERIEREIQELEIPHTGSKTSGKLSVSCGYAYTEKAERNMEQLLNEADSSLYEVKKKRGR